MTAAVAAKPTVFGEIGAIAQETLNGPWWMLKKISAGVKKDAMRIKRAGLPGAVFGFPLAALTLPLTPLTDPSSIAARAAADFDTPIGRTVASSSVRLSQDGSRKQQ